MFTIGEKIKSFREKIKLSQKDFAESIGIKAPYLSEIENGKKDITSKIIKALNESYDISADWLLFSESEINSQNTHLIHYNNSHPANLNTENELKKRAAARAELMRKNLRKQQDFERALKSLVRVTHLLKNNANREFSKDELEQLQKLSNEKTIAYPIDSKIEPYEMDLDTKLAFLNAFLNMYIDELFEKEYTGKEHAFNFDNL